MRSQGPWEALHARVTRLATHALTGRTVMIVGGSRGLGLDLGRQLAELGCKLAICARDPEEVERAQLELSGRGAAVFARPCDATQPDQVRSFVDGALARFGALDVLITCAATIQVGPLELMSRADVDEALDQIFWTSYHPTMAVLPHMRARRSGRIVHVSSFGGKLGLPHLAPYCTAKFALTGFSSSLRAELAADGITVTTITPGLLRTGAHVNAPFKGQHEKEFLWFAAGTSLPLVSLSSPRAAARILRATARGKAESALSAGIRLLVVANAVAPSLTARLFALQNRLLPGALGGSSQARFGRDIARESRSRLVRAIAALSRPNAEAHHAYPGPLSAPLPVSMRTEATAPSASAPPRKPEVRAS